jgi:hypothetical protein
MDFTFLFIQELLFSMKNPHSIYDVLENYKEYTYKVSYQNQTVSMKFNEKNEDEVIQEILKKYYKIPFCSKKETIFKKGCFYKVKQEGVTVFNNKEIFINKEKNYLENFFLSPSSLLKKKLQYKTNTIKDFSKLIKAKGILLGALCSNYLEIGSVKTLNQCDVKYFFVTQVNSNTSILIKFLDKTIKEVSFDTLYNSVKKCSLFFDMSWLFEEWFL